MQYPYLSDKEIFLLAEFTERLFEARKKHAVFAQGAYQALGYLTEELGEVAKAVTKLEGQERLKSELLDLLVVCFRMLNREHETAGEE